MEYKTIIEVQDFGDFDMIHTECIMVSPDEKDVKEIIKDFCVYMDIPSIKGISSLELDEMTQNFIAYLEMTGFKKLETVKVHMCD